MQQRSKRPIAEHLGSLFCRMLHRKRTDYQDIFNGRIDWIPGLIRLAPLPMEECELGMIVGGEASGEFPLACVNYPQVAYSFSGIYLAAREPCRTLVRILSSVISMTRLYHPIRDQKSFMVTS
jgi:hypothetical protein